MAGKLKLRHFFFKVLLGDFSHQLMIPPSFLKHMQSFRPEESILLENSQGGKWRARTEKNGDGELFLTGSGWSDFARDNALREFEFLVFGYNGEACFRVQVFGTNACERHAEMAPLRYEKGRRGYNDGRIPSVEAGVRESEPIVMEDSDAEEGKRIHKFPGGGIGHEFGREAAGGGGRFTFDRPFFTCYMRRSFVGPPYQLRTPVAFSRRHLPRIKSQLVLRDAQRRAWIVSYSPSTRSVGGWAAFVRGNHLKLGDVCAFELIEPLELRVHMHRSAASQVKVPRRR